MLEVVQIKTLVIFGLLRKGHEEADEEDCDYEDEETESPFQGASNALASCLLAMLSRILIVFLVPEVGKGDDEKTEKRIERVERVVDDAQSVDNAIDLLGRCPILLAAQAGSGGRRDECDVDGNEEDGC